MQNLEKNTIQIGFIPLLDCIALLWAEHRGFYQELGLNVELIKEASWASLRDRLTFGFLDAAHCLSAILPAAVVGREQMGISLKTPLILSQNRAFITLSQKLCHELHISPQDTPTNSAEKICNAIQHQQSFKFAHVFNQSIHHYCLREWLALSDLTLAQNIQLSTLPPPFMAEALSHQQVDGFCVGEPWNTQAEIMGTGQMILSSQDVIPPVADKVLAVTDEWALKHPNTLAKLCQAIEKAQSELKNLEHFDEVWQLLIEFGIIRFECSDSVHVDKFYAIQKIISEFIEDSARPKSNDFLWIIQQMQKWEKIELEVGMIEDIAKNCIIEIT